MVAPGFSADPFGGRPPWLGPVQHQALAQLDALLACEWELPIANWFSPLPERWGDPAWPALLLERLARHQRRWEAEALRVRLRQQGLRGLPRPQPPLLRSLHHLACTGGTLISKVIASLPDVALISELHPCNRNSAGFHPTDPLLLLEQSWRPLRPAEIREAFLADLDQAQRIGAAEDVDLVLRDHSHSDFCRGTEPAAGVLLLDWLQPAHAFRSLVTVRHPLDSWLGLTQAGWQGQFEPATLQEYCRRYGAFLDATAGMPVLRYEEFCADPQAGLAELCEALLLPFDATALERFGAVALSGDSGRRDLQRIAAPPRRPIPAELQADLAIPANRQALAQLCERMGYDLELLG